MSLTPIATTHTGAGNKETQLETLTRLFNRMDEWGQNFVLSMAEAQADKHSRRPALRVVGGGAT